MHSCTPGMVAPDAGKRVHGGIRQHHLQSYGRVAAPTDGAGARDAQGGARSVEDAERAEVLRARHTDTRQADGRPATASQRGGRRKVQVQFPIWSLATLLA